MKQLTGWVMSAALVFSGAANAQRLAPSETGTLSATPVSDVSGPYAAMPPDAPLPAPPRYGYGPTLLPAIEVYTILRESGFLPLGIPQQRGFIYTISVIDRSGDDGRLTIDARTGRIIRFMPAYRMGDNFNDDLNVTYGPARPLPPISTVRGQPRPPASVPHVASRTPQVPTPRPAPPRAAEPRPQAARPAPEPAQQSAAVKPADAPTTPRAAAPTVGQAAPPAAPSVQPTQEMPKVQGLE